MKKSGLLLSLVFLSLSAVAIGSVSKVSQFSSYPESGIYNVKLELTNPTGIASAMCVIGLSEDSSMVCAFNTSKQLRFSSRIKLNEDSCYKSSVVFDTETKTDYSNTFELIFNNCYLSNNGTMIKSDFTYFDKYKKVNESGSAVFIKTSNLK